jgi:hypothetical protein
MEDTKRYRDFYLKYGIFHTWVTESEINKKLLYQKTLDYYESYFDEQINKEIWPDLKTAFSKRYRRVFNINFLRFICSHSIVKVNRYAFSSSNVIQDMFLSSNEISAIQSNSNHDAKNQCKG